MTVAGVDANEADKKDLKVLLLSKTAYAVLRKAECSNLHTASVIHCAQ